MPSQGRITAPTRPVQPHVPALKESAPEERSRMSPRIVVSLLILAIATLGLSLVRYLGSDADSSSNRSYQALSKVSRNSSSHSRSTVRGNPLF